MPPRSIPACTGKPASPTRRAASATVYPRVYGETVGGDERSWCCSGLSPRVRGNPVKMERKYLIPRSIPACTGKPAMHNATKASMRVYPRVYGETMDSPITRQALRGLSPRVRGNPPARRGKDGDPGSIPACTGKPLLGAPIQRGLGVYPRVYGETVVFAIAGDALEGLSPRVRGNQPLVLARLSWRRSIPACTGKPERPRYCQWRMPVYPRVYGETLPVARSPVAHAGLSPRVRGNLQETRRPRMGERSIPACTGKPIFCPLHATST